MIFTELPPPDFSHSMEVSAVHCISDGSILLLKRAPEKKVEPGKWGVPAGRVHEGESKLEAALREMLEETSLRAEAEGLLFLQSVPVRYPEFIFMFHLFRYDMAVLPGKGEIRLDREHTEYAWAPLTEIASWDLMMDELACIELVTASYR